jgi:hypothetical protein
MHPSTIWERERRLLLGVSPTGASSGVGCSTVTFFGLTVSCSTVRQPNPVDGNHPFGLARASGAVPGCAESAGSNKVK